MYEISSLNKNSLSDLPPIDSSIFAPIEVPHLKICLLKTNSFFLLVKYLYKLIIRIAKRMICPELCFPSFLIFDSKFLIFNLTYLNFKVTIDNMANMMATIQNRVTILLS